MGCGPLQGLFAAVAVSLAGVSFGPQTAAAQDPESARDTRLWNAGTAMTATFLPASGAFVLAGSLAQVDAWRQPGGYWPALERWPHPGWAGLELGVAAGDFAAGADWVALATRAEDPQRARIGRSLGAMHLVLGAALSAHAIAALAVHPPDVKAELDDDEVTADLLSLFTLFAYLPPTAIFLLSDVVQYTRGKPPTRAYALAELLVAGVPFLAVGTFLAMSATSQDARVAWALPELALGAYFTVRPIVALLGRATPSARRPSMPVVAPIRGGALATWAMRF